MRRPAIIVCGVVFYIGVVTGYSQPSPLSPNDPPPAKMIAVAPFGPPGMPGPAGSRSPMLLDISELQNQLNEININKPAIEKIVVIARSFLAALDERLIKIQREELNIKEELLKENPDLKAIQGYIAKKTQVFSEIEFLQIKRDLEIKALLTQEEYDRWKSVMAQKMKRMMSPLMEKGASGGGPGVQGCGGPDGRNPAPPRQ
jgi:hypothetical protein